MSEKKSEKQTGLVMVCVTRQRQCEQLIRRGAELAQQEKLDLMVVNVQRPGYLQGEDAELLDYLMEVTRRVGGELQVLYDQEPIARLVRYARENPVRAMVLGHAPEGETPLAAAVKQALPQLLLVQAP